MNTDVEKLTDKPEIAIIVDTETGSTNIRKAGICQVAAVVLTAKGNTNTLMSSYCKPSKKIEQGAVDVHGITPDMYQWSPPQKWALAAMALYIEKMSETYTVFLAGHNACNYDIPLLQLAYPAGNFDAYPTIDTLRWARRKYPNIGHKLGELYTKLIGEEAINAHDAAADCWMTAKVLHHMKEDEQMLFRDISAELAEPIVYEFMPFGKYQGQDLLSSVPDSYLRWVRKTFTDPDIDMIATIEHYLGDEDA